MYGDYLKLEKVGYINFSMWDYVFVELFQLVDIAKSGEKADSKAPHLLSD